MVDSCFLQERSGSCGGGRHCKQLALEALPGTGPVFLHTPSRTGLGRGNPWKRPSGWPAADW